MGLALVYIRIFPEKGEHQKSFIKNVLFSSGDSHDKLQNETTVWKAFPSDECSVSCGHGFYRLDIYCSKNTSGYQMEDDAPIWTGPILDESQCDPTTRPKSSDPCHLEDCPSVNEPLSSFLMLDIEPRNNTSNRTSNIFAYENSFLLTPGTVIALLKIARKKLIVNYI